MYSRLLSRNVTVNGHRTSLRLEQASWDALDDICRNEGLSMHELCSMIESMSSGSMAEKAGIPSNQSRQVARPTPDS